MRVAGCQVIRSEKKTGTKREARTELDLLLEFLREGDALVVTRIDRLARSMKDLQGIVHDRKGRGVALKATEQQTNLRRERQMEGIAAAKVKGVYKGRPATIDPAEIRRLHKEDRLGPAAIARRLGIARSSVYRVLPKVMSRVHDDVSEVAREEALEG